MTSTNNTQTTDSQIYWVADNVIANDFPPVSSALRDPDGLLAIGGDLSSERLLGAYQKGIFPWYSEGQPILWWSPDPRCVLLPEKLKISRSLGKTLKKRQFSVTFNQAFNQVIHHCAEPRALESGTWITNAMNQAYLTLHQAGHAVSIESWHENELAGGLYGIVIGKIFFGESMFSHVTDASKVALVHLVQVLREQNFKLIDCQVYSKHLHSLGAELMQRELFVDTLKNYCQPEPPLNWTGRQESM